MRCAVEQHQNLLIIFGIIFSIIFGIMITAAGKNIIRHRQRLKITTHQQRILLPQMTEPLIPSQQFIILRSPRVCTAIKRVGQALHTGLITVINAGHARHGKLQQRHLLQAAFGQPQLIIGQRIILGRGFISLLGRLTQHSQHPWGIMGAQQVKRRRQMRGRIILF